MWRSKPLTKPDEWIASEFVGQMVDAILDATHKTVHDALEGVDMKDKEYGRRELENVARCLTRGLELLIEDGQKRHNARLRPKGKLKIVSNDGV